MAGFGWAGRMALAVIAGVATGVVTWQIVHRRRRTLGQRDPARVVPRAQQTPALPAVPPPDDIDARLDEGIEESFPASDPVSIRIE